MNKVVKKTCSIVIAVIMMVECISMELVVKAEDTCNTEVNPNLEHAEDIASFSLKNNETQQTATNIHVNEGVTDSFNSYNDINWYRFTLTNNGYDTFI